MHDAMTDLTAGDAVLGRRLEAYADERLTPDAAASSRIRARVLAVAHRRADLARADAALAVLPRPASLPAARPASFRYGRRAATALLTAALGLALVVGTTLAARPGGALYDARLWAESLALPSDPDARAVAQLERLQERLGEVVAASQAGDTGSAAAALLAYEAILGRASADVMLAGDTVASAALEAGLARNVEVLEALQARLPAAAQTGITTAIERAIVHSGDAVEAMEAVDAGLPPGRGTGSEGTDGSGAGGADGATIQPATAATPTPKATPGPTVKPTKDPKAEPGTVTAPTPTPDRKPDGGGGKPPASPDGDAPKDEPGD